MNLELATATHPGRIRSQNEDCIAVDSEAGVAVLADGMGGHNAGEVASRMAVDVVSANLKPHCARAQSFDAAQWEALVEAQIAAANSAIFEAAAGHRQYQGMGTTLVVAVWHERGVSYGHIGDSRLYLLRNGALAQLTRDHTIVQEQLERGAIDREQARHAPNRNVLTRAVGIDPEAEPDVSTQSVQSGDVYLLCSDGLTDMVTDQEIRETLLSCGVQLELAAQRLVERANASGGLDNISVILGRVASGVEGNG